MQIGLRWSLVLVGLASGGLAFVAPSAQAASIALLGDRLAYESRDVASTSKLTVTQTGPTSFHLLEEGTVPAIQFFNGAERLCAPRSANPKSIDCNSPSTKRLWLQTWTTTSVIEFVGSVPTEIGTHSSQFDRIIGGSGDDFIYAGDSGADFIDGRGGDDRVSFNPGSAPGVVVNLKTGSSSQGDTLRSIEGLWGGLYNDTLIGDDGPNRLFGGGGNDTIDGAGGADWMAGGNDFDVVTYEKRTQPVTVDLRSAGGDGAAGENDDVEPTTDGVVGGAGDDVVYGRDGANGPWGFGNVLIGGPGNDRLLDFGGDDLLFGEDGNDQLSGGAGRDALSGGAGADSIGAWQNGGSTAPDTVDCGPGVDPPQLLDRVDILFTLPDQPNAHGCESVFRLQ